MNITFALIVYLVTGFVMAFDWCMFDSNKGKHHGLFETGFIMLVFTLFWLPIVVLCTYWYALALIYTAITEEE